MKRWLLIATVLLAGGVAPGQQKRSTPGPVLATGLGEASVAELQGLMADWLRAGVAAAQAEAFDSPAIQRHREAWQRVRDWVRRDQGKALRYMGDMLRVFATALPYQDKQTTGRFKLVKNSDGLFGWRAPLDYRKQGVRYRTIVVLPRKTGSGTSADPKTYYDATWAASAQSTNDTFVLVPKLTDDEDYEVLPRLEKPAELEEEAARIATVFDPFAELHRTYNLDRRLRVLDCGQGTVLFGLRVALYHPSIFAGLVLRYPKGVRKLLKRFPVESLTGQPVLVAWDLHTRDEALFLAKTLNQLREGSCTLIDARYEDKELQLGIEAWARKVERPLFPRRVVVAPARRKLTLAHWVTIEEMSARTSGKHGPRLEVVADREQNQITVRSRQVAMFSLQLNDALVDLSKPVSIVWNGVTQKRRFRRSIRYMAAEMARSFDPTHLYAAWHRASTPGFRAARLMAELGDDRGPSGSGSERQRSRARRTTRDAGIVGEERYEPIVSGDPIPRLERDERDWIKDQDDAVPEAKPKLPVHVPEEDADVYGIDQSVLWGLGLLAAFLLGIGIALLLQRSAK